MTTIQPGQPGGAGDAGKLPPKKEEPKKPLEEKTSLVKERSAKFQQKVEKPPPKPLSKSIELLKEKETKKKAEEALAKQKKESEQPQTKEQTKPGTITKAQEAYVTATQTEKPLKKEDREAELSAVPTGKRDEYDTATKFERPVTKEDASARIAPGTAEKQTYAYVGDLTGRKLQPPSEMEPAMGLRLEDRGIDDRVKAHRQPTINVVTWIAEKTPDGSTEPAPGVRSHHLTDVRDAILKQKQANLTPEQKNDKRYNAQLKQEANKEVYDGNYMSANINKGLYDPGAIAAEMKNVLKFSDQRPAKLLSEQDAWKEIEKEITTYQTAGKQGTPIFSKENIEHLKTELTSVMTNYLKAYPKKSYGDAYQLALGMVRAAAYQMYYDKWAFTGSDHGVLHIFHNCEHGHHMHEGMKEHGDSNLKAELISKIVHFYHDIGYSVGSAPYSFEVMKDHPFIGAAFIKANEKYFNDLLDPEATKIIEQAILHHAIVSFDPGDAKKDDPINNLKMVRFTTSNSDACAVTADQKTQTFWRDHPETLLELAKLRMFITIFPNTQSVLGNPSIIKKPEVAMQAWLKQDAIDRIKQERTNNPNDIPKFLETDFKQPEFYKAWQIHNKVKNNLLDITTKVDLPKEEREAFQNAILENFNAFGADVVFKQFGAELNDVSVKLNPKYKEHPDIEPKYLPKITMSPSTLAAFLESCFSSDLARGNIKKLAVDEYFAKPDDINNAIDEVGAQNDPNAKKDVETPVASITIQKAKTQHPPNIHQVVDKLENIRDNTVPLAARKTLNELFDSISPQVNKGTANEPKDDKGNRLEKVGTNFYREDWLVVSGNKLRAFTSEYTQDILKLSDTEYDEFLKKLTDIGDKLSNPGGGPSAVSESDRLELTKLLTTQRDWDLMELNR